MTGKRVGLTAAVGTLLLVIATRPALAQSTSSSTTEGLIWGLNYELLAVAIPITILVEGILLYTVWRFRASRQEEASPTQENRRLEITWTVGTAIILLFVGVGGFQVLAQPHVSNSAAADPGADAVEVDVIAQTYVWNFEYPDSGATSTNTLVLPVNETVRLNVTSTDWLHSFHVPDLGLKQDAFPGQSNVITTRVTETGTYQLYCAEYCGSGHSKMLGTVEVVPQDEYEQWVAENSPETTADSANATSAD
jgi:cytochrome c oxidase subunit 2